MILVDVRSVVVLTVLHQHLITIFHKNLTHPPAIPRPPGCFLCFPTRPCPAETWPRLFVTTCQPRLILNHFRKHFHFCVQVPSRCARALRSMKRGRIMETYCFLVFDNRVGMSTVAFGDDEVVRRRSRGTERPCEIWLWAQFRNSWRE